jgi:uncharacterized 2Fe-2S/4Fe-4S cluster protein (DUF4445 family)
MLGLRPTIILSLALTLLVNTVTASSGGKGSCNKCQTKIHDCMRVSMTNKRQLRLLDVLTRSLGLHIPQRGRV